MTQAPDLPGTVPAETAAVRATREALSAGPCLVLLIAPAGAGKSTLARELAAAPDQVLSLDRLRAVVSGDECDQEPPATCSARPRTRP